MMRLLNMLHHFVESDWVEQVGWVLLHSLSRSAHSQTYSVYEV